MRSLLLSIILMAVLSPCISQKKVAQNNSYNFKDLDTAFTRVLKNYHAAGFAVAIVDKDHVIYSNGFGYRDVEKKIPVTANTLFAIGSCTKAFTASMIGVLGDQSKLDIDKPVINYLPDLKFYNDAMNNSITLRDMMSHRTGLPRHDLSWYFFATESRDSLMKRIRYMEPSAAVRERWQYNNFMFAAQGVVIEKITGKTWEQNIKENFLSPLGMNSTVFSASDLMKAPEPSLGYGVLKDSMIKKLDYYNITGMGPAGSIVSSVNDMSKWVMTWINGGKSNGKQIIPVSHYTQAISSQAIASPGLPTKEKPDLFFANYGFGWSLSSYRGHYRVEHGGNIDGFSASTSFFPTDSIGIIVLTNQNGSGVPGVVRNILADKILRLKYVDWDSDLKAAADKAIAAQKAAMKSVVSNRKAGTKPSHRLSDYTGVYNNPGYGDFVINEKRDSLFVNAGTQQLYLRHYHYDIFDVLNNDPIEGIDTTGPVQFKFQFNMNEAGDINSLSFGAQPGLKPIEFTKQNKAQQVKEGSLEKYKGDYELSGTIVKLSVRNNVLYALVPGQPEYELVPLGNDRFGLKVINGYFVQFNINDKGVVNALTFEQPNGNFKAVKK
ncbi:MAG: serine hydrolase [Ginsengibacter sp.]